MQGEAELEGPSESECRPYIEKALKELETGEPTDTGSSETGDSKEDLPTIEITDDADRQDSEDDDNDTNEDGKESGESIEEQQNAETVSEQKVIYSRLTVSPFTFFFRIRKKAKEQQKMRKVLRIRYICKYI